jgi:adenosylmethionine-8-amino-7-oxononanoate aminotransferase
LLRSINMQAASSAYMRRFHMIQPHTPFGEAELTALAIRVTGPVLYVGSKHEAIPRSFEAAGLSVTTVDIHDTCEPASRTPTDSDATERFCLVVLPKSIIAEWSDRSDANVFIARIVSCLMPQGAVVVVREMPLALAAAESKFERTLITAGFIIVDSTAADASRGGARFVTYKRRVSSPLCHPFSGLPLSSTPGKVLTLTQGHGIRVRDSADKEYIDACSGLWNTHLGLGNLEVIDAVSAQLHRLSYATLFAGRGNQPARELAEVLVSVAPYPLQWVCYTSSGSESTDLGIRVALIYAQLCGRKDAKRIAHLDESYHGTFGGSASVSGLLPYKQFFEHNSIAMPIPTPNPAKCPAGESYVKFALRCADVLDQKAREGDIAAFIFEPIPASAGVIVPPAEYFERIQSICTRHRILLIADEVATGFGRTGRWFACEHFGLRPDIMLMAKGINSGYLPLGAVMFSAAIGEKFVQQNMPLLHGSTYNGHPACCASALANIAILKRENLVERSEHMGRHLRQVLEENLLGLPVVAEVRGLGLMQGVVLKQLNGQPVSPLQSLSIGKKIQESGVLTYPMPGVIGLCPALTITREDIDLVVETVRAVLFTLRLEDGAVHWAESAAPIESVDLRLTEYY